MMSGISYGKPSLLSSAAAAALLCSSVQRYRARVGACIVNRSTALVSIVTQTGRETGSASWPELRNPEKDKTLAINIEFCGE